MIAPPVARAYTAEELAARNVEARGGLDNLHAVRSLRLAGKQLVNGGTIRVDFVALVKPPQSIRYEIMLQGLTQVSVGSKTGAPTLGSGGCSTAFAVALSPATMVTFPAPAESNVACGLQKDRIPVGHWPFLNSVRAARGIA
jgi:hypothetical protein